MTGTILEKIIEAKRVRVAHAKRQTSTIQLSDIAAERTGHTRRERFRDSISNPSRLNIIAEFKRASPSRGMISDRFSPAQIARAYKSAGAAAVSVLTEEDFFGGSLNDLHEVRDQVSIPILRKDFIIDEFQILESAAAGADAILLIVAALNETELKHFLGFGREVGLDVLVEVHDDGELETVLRVRADLIGVNNRDLRTFEVSLEVSDRLVKKVAAGNIMVAESGIRSHEDVRRLKDAGFSAFLIGEKLMRSENPAQELLGLLGAEVRIEDGIGVPLIL